MRAATGEVAPGGAEEGFTLIEVMIALAVFVVVSTSVLSMLLTSTSAARGNTRTSVATALAARQIESARSQRAIDIPNGAITRTETVSGVAYTITQTASYVAADATTSLCTGGSGRLANKLITVTVRWPGMGSASPVRSDTLRALGVGADGLDGANAVVAVAVRSGLDLPVSGVQVTLGPLGTAETTGVDGCAVFVGLTPGNYTVTPIATGHVDPLNDPDPAATTVAATAGAVSRVTLLYDEARSVATSPAGPAGFVVPNGGLPVMVRSSYLSARTLPACSASISAGCAAGDPPTLTGVFPAVYSLWLGTCLDAEVGTSVDLSGSSPPAAVAVASGAALVDVQVLGVSTAGRVVTATHAADPVGGGGCPAGASHVLPATAEGGLGVLLPYGAWTFETAGALPVTATIGPGGTSNVTLAATL